MKENKVVNLQSLNNLSNKKNENHSLNNLIKSSNTSQNSSREIHDNPQFNQNQRYDTEDQIFHENSIIVTQNNEMCNISPSNKNIQYNSNNLKNLVGNSNRPFSSAQILNESNRNQIVHPPSTKSSVSNNMNNMNSVNNMNSMHNVSGNLMKETNKTIETTKSNIQFIYNSVRVKCFNIILESF